MTDALCPTQLRELRGRNQLLRDRTALPSPHPDLCHQLKGLCWITRPEAGERGQAGLLPAATAPRVPEVPAVPGTRIGSGNNDPKASPREELPRLGPQGPWSALAMTAAAQAAPAASTPSRVWMCQQCGCMDGLLDPSPKCKPSHESQGPVLSSLE